MGSPAVDELRTGLELATEDELQAMTEILFCRKFNPLDYVCTPEPFEVQQRGRNGWLDALEERFRFLAADGLTVLRRQTHCMSYQQILVQVCRHLKIRYDESMSAAELESEIFLHLLERAWLKLPAAKRRVVSAEIQEALSHSQIAAQIPPAVKRDPVGLALKGGSAIAFSSVIRPWILQHLTRQIALHAATYQTVATAVTRGGAAVATQWQHRLALNAASRGVALSAARYSAVRTVFAMIGPALWTWFLADLGWRAIATNYARIIPVIFTLAQIRLTRTECYGIA